MVALSFVLYKIACILVYDQQCMSNASCIPMIDSIEDTHSQPPTCHSNGSSNDNGKVTIFWFDTILNHALVIFNVFVFYLCHKILNNSDESIHIIHVDHCDEQIRNKDERTCGKDNSICNKKLGNDNEDEVDSDAAPLHTKNETFYTIANDRLETNIMKEWKTRTTIETQHYQTRRSIPSLGTSLICFLFVTLFQIVLCLSVKCVGVSIVWCSMSGWSFMLLLFFRTNCHWTPAEKKLDRIWSNNDDQIPSENIPLMTNVSNTLQSSNLFKHTEYSRYAKYSSLWTIIVILGIDAVTIVYYATIAEMITTVAHVCAIILGVLMWKIAIACELKRAIK